MPRGPRLDAPGVVHHVMARGIEGRPIFRDDGDRDDFIRRLASLADAGALKVYAWALLPNHFHLLVRTGLRPLPRAMRSLLTGYAGAFNRRHRRRGHLFQNRYKSIVCEEESYLLELVRYLHLNPLRAGVVEDLPGLDRYAHSGHAALVGRRERPWQDTGEIWARFGGRRRVAQARYRAFVAEGLRQGRRAELQGGGLLRSAGGWAAVRALRRGREAFTADERVLGGSAFVATLLREVDAQGKGRRGGRLRELSASALITQVCRAVGASDAAVRSHRRTPEICRAREGIAYLWVEILARSGRRLAEALGIRPESVYKAARRGRLAERRWGSILRELEKSH